ncbi:HAD-IIA family hydrolase [Roseovarius spongiae]|uniref:HAD-IIA family hydrolase n=1 Tax=Roseovarius spongiae TaxID=2320272 RepID=A0A3A8ATI6_9RHOB|nr:HAD-IIA family hydrolase [Roseovarius spongiae]RKF14874.1 HAD-IIA family hydrolase [Roseovarius spongiae]
MNALAPDAPTPVDPAEAFAAYLRLRHRLPAAARQGLATPARFLDIVTPFDLILFDAYGVLNVGETAIPGAADAIAALRGMGKAVAVASNSAAYPKSRMMARYAALGFDFAPEEVVTSREALLDRLTREPNRRWGMMLNPQADTAEFSGLDHSILTDAPEDYARAEGFLLIGSDGWTNARQALLEDAVRAHPRPVLVGNPDLVAPRETGLSREPGWFAHALADATGVAPEFLGKPFPDIFDLALARRARPPAPGRVLMVGDTLHTDILGGQQAGFATALVTARGALAGLDVADAIRRSGIAPDFVVDAI